MRAFDRFGGVDDAAAHGHGQRQVQRSGSGGRFRVAHAVDPEEPGGMGGGREGVQVAVPPFHFHLVTWGAEDRRHDGGGVFAVKGGVRAPVRQDRRQLGAAVAVRRAGRQQAARAQHAPCLPDGHPRISVVVQGVKRGHRINGHISDWQAGAVGPDRGAGRQGQHGR
jgi:hypothetical protein